MKDVSLSPLHDLSVLMAENHAGMRQPLTRTLGLFFNEALQAEDGKQALELFRIH